MQANAEPVLDKLFLIDSSAPFFRKHPKGVINWSKAPHHLHEKKGRLRGGRSRRVREGLKIYLDQAVSRGYNAVTFDELSRLVSFSFYSGKLKARLRRYRSHFRKIFRIASERKLRIFVTSDVFFFNQEIDRATRGKTDRVFKLIRKSVKKLFRRFPEVDGLVFRVGESDGVDVKGEFRSRLFLKTPALANRFLRELLPLFEKRKKTLIFRTWTVGAWPLGDLLWNPATYRKTFRGIDSPALIVSAKYGNADFFRYLEVSPHFFADQRKKIVELQARREYEGFGEIPSFIGDEYRKVYEGLRSCRHLVGVQVWCQTGGWSRFRNRTFSKKSSLWNEINTSVVVPIFRDGASVKDAVARVASEFFPKPKSGREGEWGRTLADFQLFLEHSELTVRQLLYDPLFARKTFFINRVRIPPLIHIFWDHVTVTDPIVALYRHAVGSPEESLRFGREALGRIEQMAVLAKKLDLPYRAGFHRRTFELFFEVRRLIYAASGAAILKKLRHDISKYEKRFPDAYRFKIEPSEKGPGFWLRFAVGLLVRNKPAYRLLDRILFHPFLSRCLLFFLRKNKKLFPSFVGNQAMGLEHFLK